jgi:hypothetical protein
VLKSRVGSQLWETQTLRWLLIHVELVKLRRIRENIKILAKKGIGYYELKKHKPWFDEGCSKLLDQRKQDILQWLQNPSEINGDNLNNIRHETSRRFRNKRGNI